MEYIEAEKTAAIAWFPLPALLDNLALARVPQSTLPNGVVKSIQLRDHDYA